MQASPNHLIYLVHRKEYILLRCSPVKDSILTFHDGKFCAPEGAADKDGWLELGVGVSKITSEDDFSYAHYWLKDGQIYKMPYRQMQDSMENILFRQGLKFGPQGWENLDAQTSIPQPQMKFMTPSDELLTELHRRIDELPRMKPPAARPAPAEPALPAAISWVDLPIALPQSSKLAPPYAPEVSSYLNFYIQAVKYAIEANCPAEQKNQVYCHVLRAVLVGKDVVNELQASITDELARVSISTEARQLRYALSAECINEMKFSSKDLPTIGEVYDYLCKAITAEIYQYQSNVEAKFHHLPKTQAQAKVGMLIRDDAPTTLAGHNEQLDNDAAIARIIATEGQYPTHARQPEDDPLLQIAIEASIEHRSRSQPSPANDDENPELLAAIAASVEHKSHSQSSTVNAASDNLPTNAEDPELIAAIAASMDDANKNESSKSSKELFLTELSAYIEARANKATYLHFYGRIFGFSREQKLNAAKKLKRVIDADLAYKFSAQEAKILRQGELGKIVERYQDLLPENLKAIENSIGYNYGYGCYYQPKVRK